jgi:hypothetical protein
MGSRIGRESLPRGVEMPRAPTAFDTKPAGPNQPANTRPKPIQERATAMPAAIKDCSICVALILALAAAVISTPGQFGFPYQALQWLQVGACAEVNTLAGAIGEIPANCPAP